MSGVESNGPLSGKVALVTGGSGGIGRGIAIRLAQQGATVVVGGRSTERAQAAVDELRAYSDSSYILGDVCSRDDMEAACSETASRFGGIDIVVANAGGGDEEARSPQVRGPFADIDLERVTGFVRQALAAKLNVVQAAIPHLRSRGGGSVIFVTSEGGREPTPGQTAISSFSGGLVMASKVLSKELARDRIRVNTVCVTVVRDTPSWDAVFGPDSIVSDQHRKQYTKILQRSPFGVAAPTDIGDVVAYLAGPGSAFLTGTTVSPTGGLTVH